MSEYVYHLARWQERDKRLRCPQCGKSHGSYKEYVDAAGHAVDPEGHLCGKCDSENRCGYHLTPAEFFKLHPDQRRSDAPIVIEQRQADRIEIPIDKVLSTLKHYEMNRFVCWLETLPLDADQRKLLPNLLKLYLIGTSKDGGTIWWQVDGEDVARTGKKMLYGEDGHRLKDEEGNSIGFNWVHAMMRRCGYNTHCDECNRHAECPFPRDRFDLVQCLFGEHLLKTFAACSVHIVESEKTALLMALLDRDLFSKNIWLATGSKNNIRLLLQAPLNERDVIVYPDKDAMKGKDNWPDKVKELGIKCRISDAAVRASTPEDGEKCDIADIMLRRLMQSKEAVADAFSKKYPNVQLLIDKLNLQPE